jgi:hypothetical protein
MAVAAAIGLLILMLLEDPSVETYEKQKHENKSYFS